VLNATTRTGSLCNATPGNLSTKASRA